MKRTSLAAATIVLLSSIASAGKIEDLSFISGSWVYEKDETVTEELWSAPKAGTMFGVGRTMKGDKTVFFEFLRIETKGEDLFYVAQPRGGKPVPFKLTSFDGKIATFENPEHDFPKKIVYEKLNADTVRTTVSGEQNGTQTAETWEYRRAK